MPAACLEFDTIERHLAENGGGAHSAEPFVRSEMRPEMRCDRGAERIAMREMTPWSRPWIIHRIKVAVLVLVVFIMPVILFAISDG